MLNITRIPAPRVALVDSETGLMSREWFRFFNNIYTIVGANLGVIQIEDGGTGLSTAPTNGQLLIGDTVNGYVLNTLNPADGITVTNGAGTITLTNTGVLSFSGGNTGLTPATATNGNVVISGLLNVASGGTNQSSYVDGELLIGNTTGNTLTKSTLTAGTAIGISNGAGAITITNTLPDQTVVLTNGTGISITGTYPSFTITNTSPSSGGTVTSITAGTGLTGGTITTTGTIAIDSTVATLTGTQTLTNKTLTSPKANEILDTNGNESVVFSPTTSATDYFVMKNGIGVGAPLHLYADGSSANTGVHIQPKGTGLVTISDGTDFSKGIRFRSSSSAASAVTLLDAVSSAGRVVTLPDATTTLVGRDTTDTLTNKSISGATNTLSNIGNASLTNSTISGVALGGNLFNLTAGTGVSFSAGTTYNGSAAITINATGTGGTVTSVAALTLGTTGTDLSSTVANGTTTPVITLQVPTASATNRGALSAADWTTFNGKAPGVTFTTNYIPYGQGTTTLNQSAGLQFDGTNFTTTGYATATSFRPSSSTIPTNGMYLPSANTIAFSTNSVQRFIANSAGGFVINPPTSGTALTVSGVSGQAVVDASGVSVGARLTCYKVQNTDTTAGATAAVTFFTGDDGTAGRTRAVIESASGTANNGYLAFSTRNAGTVAEKMRIWGTGGVSIGNTTDPGATNLSVTGTTSAASFIPTSSTVPTNGVFLPAANTVGFATNSGERMRIDASGNLGIGTASPAYKLDVVGSIARISNAGAAELITRNSTSSTNWEFGVDGASNGFIYSGQSSAMAFSNSGTERMRIHASGGLSLGNTTDPGATNLSVTGTGKFGTTVGVGAATPSTSGAGITFPATQSASTNANTLDDYEEGTWTPAQGGNLTVVGTYSSSGSYTKVGRQVTVVGQLNATTSLAVTSGGVLCTGIPFATHTAGGAAVFTGGLTNATVTATSLIVGSVTNLYATTAIGATTVMYFSATYMTD